MTEDILYFRIRKKSRDGLEMINGAPIPDFQLPYTAVALGGQNGRINFTSRSPAGGLTVPDSAGFAYPTKTEKTFTGDMLRGNWETNPVAQGFFTAQNINSIQSSIRRGVYAQSGNKQYTIDDQSVDELKIVMRALYLQYAKNNPQGVEQQIQELNELVIGWCIPRILSEIDHHYYYLNDISHLPVPFTQPMNMSSAGTRSLPLQPYM